MSYEVGCIMRLGVLLGACIIMWVYYLAGVLFGGCIIRGCIRWVFSLGVLGGCMMWVYN